MVWWLLPLEGTCNCTGKSLAWWHSAVWCWLMDGCDAKLNWQPAIEQWNFHLCQHFVFVSDGTCFDVLFFQLLILKENFNKSCTGKDFFHCCGLTFIAKNFFFIKYFLEKSIIMSFQISVSSGWRESCLCS